MKVEVTIAIVETDQGVYVEHKTDGALTGSQVAYALQHFVRLLVANGASVGEVYAIVHHSLQAGPAMRVQ